MFGEVNADILSIQEDSDYFDSDKTIDSYDSIYSLWYPFCAKDYSMQYRSNRIYSKYPLYNAKFKTFKANIDGIARTYTTAIADVNGIDVFIISAHLSLDKETRISQMRELEELVSEKENYILCGDFNIENTNEFLEFSGNKANCGLFGNFETSRNSGLPRDNIITNFNINYSSMLSFDKSDHYSITANTSLTVKEYYECQNSITGKHSYVGTTIKQPSCIEKGEKLYSCEMCGDTYTEEIPALGHTEAEAVLENIVDPTCTKDGHYDSVVYCLECGQELSRETVTVEVTGHQETEIKNAKSATCTEAGYTGDKVCTVCGETVEHGEEIPALGHEYSVEWTVDKEATCAETGLMSHHCKRYDKCGAVSDFIVVPAKGHTESDWEIIIEATNTQKGVRKKTCVDCGITLKTEYYDFVCKHINTEAEAVIENTVDPTCTQDGHYDTVVYCSECGKELSRETVTVEATGHQETGIKNAKSATCIKAGYTGDKVCTICGEIVEKGKEISAFGHKFVTKNAKSATYFAKGYTGDKVCTVCSEIVEKGKAIAQLKLVTPEMTVKVGSKSFKVTYTAVNGATGFQLRYRLSGKWIVKKFDTNKMVTKTISKLKKGKMYTVQIRAFAKSGSKKAYSKWTSVKKIKVY